MKRYIEIRPTEEKDCQFQCQREREREGVVCVKEKEREYVMFEKKREREEVV